MPELSHSDCEFLALINTMGHAVLVETMKEAAYYVSHSNLTQTDVCRASFYRIHEAKSCYYFVQGTGLDAVIERYGLLYSPDRLRSQFNYYIRKSV